MATAEPLAFGRLLKRHRLAAGCTQAELAERAGISSAAVTALERGINRAPHQDTVERLATALQLAVPDRVSFQAAARAGRVGGGWRAAQPPSAPAPLTVPAAAPALVGRARELVLLERHLAGEGSPLLLLAGEPGIGKTRLLQEAALRARAQGWTVLEGGCTRRSGQEPYAPLLEALAGYVRGQSPVRLRAELEGCAWLVRLLPELGDTTLVPAPSWSLPPEQERRLMFHAVGRFLANVAGPTGTLLVLDDLQWAGVDALDLLAELVRAAPERPLRVVGAYRETDVRPEDALPTMLTDQAREGLAGQMRLRPLSLEPVMNLRRAAW
jgi:transcriptional regulator with XRE-family HTH domain